MSSTAIHPEPPTEPKKVRVDVIYDSNPFADGWAVARLESTSGSQIALRLPLGDISPGTAVVKTRSAEYWLPLPQELAPAILQVAERLRAVEQEKVLRGYQEMAADEEREEEAFQWSETLIGDSLETR